MTSPCIISFQHIGTVSAGEGLCNTNFDRLALNITYATWQGEFLTGTIPEVPNDAEYVKQCRDLRTAFPSINKSSLIETSDGVPLAWFIKQGMIFPWGWVGQQLDRLANIAIVTLTKLYKPPTAIKTDVRHELAFAEESAKARGDKAPYSVYVSNSMSKPPTQENFLTLNSIFFSRGQQGPAPMPFSKKRKETTSVKQQQ